jgi:hypothetical protein
LSVPPACRFWTASTGIIFKRVMLRQFRRVCGTQAACQATEFIATTAFKKRDNAKPGR